MSEEFNEIQVILSGKWSASDILISNITSTRMIDKKIEQAALDAWEYKVQQAKLNDRRIWDSIIFRYEGFKLKNKKLLISVSEIPFSIRLGMNQCTEDIKALGNEYAPLGMFNSCFVETSDSKLVFIEKSKKFFTEKINSFVGGVYSKSESVINSGEDLFSTTIQELIEELGIGVNQIQENNLITVYKTENWNVCFIFFITLKISSDELREIFFEKSDEEASNIIFFSKNEINKSKNYFDEKDKTKFAFLKNL